MSTSKKRMQKQPAREAKRSVRRTSLNLDSVAVSEAAAVLGTRNATETIHAALAAVVRQQMLSELAAWQPNITLERLAELRESREAELAELGWLRDGEPC